MSVVVRRAVLASIVSVWSAVAHAQSTAAALAGLWVQQSGTVRSSTTSTSSILLPSGVVRTYFFGSTGIVYAESTDASSLASTQATSIGIPTTGQLLSNPAVIRLSNGTFLIVYELSSTSSSTSDRRLYSATSSDGVTFGTASVLPSSSIDTDIETATAGRVFQSVPNLVQTSSGTVRLYYTAAGVSVASMTSTDNGANWTQDSGYRLQGSVSGTTTTRYVDPDVKIMSDGTYAMLLAYQSVVGLTQTSSIRLATSTDGSTFTMLPVDSVATTGLMTLDPDVVRLANGTWVMLYGSGTSGSSIDLKRAVLDSTNAVRPATGWWWNASESGRGFSIETLGENYFVGDFLYNTDGTSIWYVSSGARGGSIFHSTLEQYGSGQTLSGSYRAPSGLGSQGRFTLSFSSTTEGTLIWPGGTISIVRFPIDGTSVVAPATGMPESGWYWSSSESGRGYFMEIQGSNMFFAAYMYNDSGQATWYLSSGAMTSTSLYQGTLSEYADGQSLTGTYRSPRVTASRGTISIAFSSTTTATLTLPSGTQVSIVRYTF
jgi:hypothetical protein